MEGCQVNKRNSELLKSVKIELENLVCEGSYDDLQELLPKTDGIVEVDIDRKLKAAFIDYDPEKITQEAITEKISECGCRIK